MSGTTKEPTSKVPMSPFKDIEELKKEVTGFVNRYKASVVHKAERVSDFFEMSCFNRVVRFYERCGYQVTPVNLQKGLYKYKCSPAGIQSNFSFFKITFKDGDETHVFEVQHNLAVQSAHDPGIYTTPDITIIREDSVRYTKEHYENKNTFSYVSQTDLVSFCEAKQFTPFPELLFNFMGIVNELSPSVLMDGTESMTPTQLAPTLMVSGKGGRHALAIKQSLEFRYCINILFDLFYYGGMVFSKKYLDQLRRVGPLAAFKPKSSLPEKRTKDEAEAFFDWVLEEFVDP